MDTKPSTPTTKVTPSKEPVKEQPIVSAYTEPTDEDMFYINEYYGSGKPRFYDEMDNEM